MALGLNIVSHFQHIQFLVRRRTKGCWRKPWKDSYLGLGGACRFLQIPQKNRIGFYSLILHIKEDSKDDESRLSDVAKNEELKRVAILISGMINDNLQVYITESVVDNGTEESN